MRPIHPFPVAGLDIPIASSSFAGAWDGNPPAICADRLGDSAATIAIAAEPSGAIFLGRRPLNIAPVCSLGTINWGGLGYEVIAYDTSTTVNNISEARSTVQNLRTWSSSRRADTCALIDGQYKPKLLRTPTLSQTLLEALPTNSPRATSGTLTFATSTTRYRADQWNAAGGSDKIEREELKGRLLSFPMLGVQRVIISILIEATISGTPLEQAFEIPLRACFIPVSGTERLYDWPSTLSFDAQDGLALGYGSGLIPTITKNIPVLLSTDNSITYSSDAQFEVEVPPSGLGILFAEINPLGANYWTFARSIMRDNGVGAAFDTTLKWTAKVYAVLAKA